jgi:LCP family protein required for cell wall assembly
LKSGGWFFVFLLAAVIGVGSGYFITLVVQPNLLPPALRWGGLREPTTILFLGTDVVYSQERGRARPDAKAFNGRSDTILVARLDPIRNSLSVLSIPRDTEVYLTGYGRQKINSVNAIGGPTMAKEIVSQFLGLPIDHYVVLNVHGLVDLVNELGGVTVEIPKRMKYMDWTAKLKIDLQPGYHTLTGNQAMGFVRFRHDALGDIGRVQRQEIFLRAVLDKALQPASWAHLPQLIQIGHQHLYTDLTEPQMLSALAFVRAVPKRSQQLVMLPGRFSADGSGNWAVDQNEIKEIAARITGGIASLKTRGDVRVVIQNVSSVPSLGRRLGALLRAKGYTVVSIIPMDRSVPPRSTTRIIAQRANPEDAEMVKIDLSAAGEVINASVGDIESGVTIMAGDDLVPVLENSPLQAAH